MIAKKNGIEAPAGHVVLNEDDDEHTPPNHNTNHAGQSTGGRREGGRWNPDLDMEKKSLSDTTTGVLRR